MPEFDAYKVLQVDRQADLVVVRAAYRALARRYHPDGEQPDPKRMMALNRAYALVRTPEARAAYDRRSLLAPVGPGATSRFATTPAGPFARAAQRNGRGPDAGSSIIPFGRYAGWSIAELARRDPDYLRWLCRHSAGLRFRAEIQGHLGPDPDLSRRASATA